MKEQTIIVKQLTAQYLNRLGSPCPHGLFNKPPYGCKGLVLEFTNDEGQQVRLTVLYEKEIEGVLEKEAKQLPDLTQARKQLGLVTDETG